MKEKIFKKGTMRRLFSVVLALTMVVALMPINSIIVYAGTSTFPDKSEHTDCNHTDAQHFYSDGTTWYKEGWEEYIFITGRYISKTGDVDRSYYMGCTTNTSFAAHPDDFNNEDYSAGWYYKNTDNKWYPCPGEAHTHTWSYGVENTSKLVATCTCNDKTEGYDSCAYKDKTGNDRKVSLTLTATSPNYSGNTATVGYEAGQVDAWKAALGVGNAPEIKYYVQGEKDELPGAPNIAGKYVAKAEYNDYTISVSFEIKDHNLTPATATMVGITLDDEKFVFNADSIAAIFSQKGVSVSKGDLVAYSVNADEFLYNLAGYNGSTWENVSMRMKLEGLKENLSNVKIYVIGTVQEPQNCSPAIPVKKTSEDNATVEPEPKEELMPVSPVSIDTTHYGKSESEVVPSSAYNLSKFVTTEGFIKGINTAVAAANKDKKNTAEIYSSKPFCFNKAIIKAIQSGKKTVVYYFVHKGHIYSVTIPANVDASKVLEKGGHAGPLYVGKVLGTTRLIK